MYYYTLCIDTDQYAGNFEREMTAYCTGQIGECSVGDDQAALFHEDMADLGRRDLVEALNDKIVQRPDDHGCYRPCYIVPTPGWSNNGMGVHTRLVGGEVREFPAYNSVGIFFNEEPTVEEMDLIVGRAVAFVPPSWKNLPRITIEGARLLKTETKVEETLLKRLNLR